MKRGECGHVTLFLSLLLISFLLILSVCLEGIYVRMQMGSVMEQQLASGEYGQANYHKELLKQYHIFAVDGRYVSKMEADLAKNWKQNMAMAPVSLSLADCTYVTDHEGDVLRHQIREYMKYGESTKILQTIKNSLAGIEEEEETRSIQKQVDNISEQDEPQKESSEAEKVKDPRRSLKELLSHGILNLVIPENYKISEEKVLVVYGKPDQKADKKIDFYKKDSVVDYLSQQEKETAIGNLTTEGLSAEYALEVFQNAVNQKSDQGIQYEVEYLIAGKDNDEANLKSVVNRLLGIRFCLNYACLLSDSSKQAQAYGLAVSIGNVASAVPAVVEGIKMLIMAAWAYGESVIDLRGLLKGNKVPFVKNAENWQLSLKNLADLSAEEKTSKSGTSYEDYLKILLLLQSDKKEKYMRMMDLMEQRIQLCQPDFLLSECCFSYEMKVKVEIDSLFFRNTYSVENSRIYVY